ncbi:retrovirus-related Pol polyprotein from transposon 17.6 [Nephila pilipes]|uniref:Retrovirus-related Pol polyprotein from transposon 17.6 n=1 Tax=Nephila pilipes TaxID=299642 RepID=A0A8X6UHC4_NEPPI|nr:retrovirus-related Pol polyprotein from transposon 17.6 [Nephila pilipes]
MAPDNIEKTAITTPFWPFEFLRIPYGLRNATQAFQRFFHSTLQGLDFCFVYNDGFLIVSHNDDEHLSHLCQIFERLKEAGLIINAGKCRFDLLEVIYLGHKINAFGIEPTAERIKIIKEFFNQQQYKT